MSDHVDGPRSIGEPAADVTDLFAFTSRENPARTVLAMCVFPSAGEDATVRLLRAVDLYTAPFLEDIDAPWCAEERARLRRHADKHRRSRMADYIQQSDLAAPSSPPLDFRFVARIAQAKMPAGRGSKLIARAHQHASLAQ